MDCSDCSKRNRERPTITIPYSVKVLKEWLNHAAYRRC
nr:MAG TPA: hypothetical protein [Bacteriophage sp.]